MSLIDIGKEQTRVIDVRFDEQQQRFIFTRTDPQTNDVTEGRPSPLLALKAREHHLRTGEKSFKVLAERKQKNWYTYSIP